MERVIENFAVWSGFRTERLLSCAGELGRYVDGADPTKVLDRCKEFSAAPYSMEASVENR
jgi:hypothetical protein